MIMEQQDSFQLGELEYWRLKCKLLELETERAQLSNALANVVERKNALLMENKIEPGKLYRFNDEKLEISEVKQNV
jgi:hypothetical protein